MRDLGQCVRRYLDQCLVDLGRCVHYLNQCVRYLGQCVRYLDQCLVDLGRCVRYLDHWLDQAELLLRAFTERYLKRGDWKSREHLVEHLDASWREYNERFAHPIAWSWTRRHLRRWAARHAPRLC